MSKRDIIEEVSQHAKNNNINKIEALIELSKNEKDQNAFISCYICILDSYFFIEENKKTKISKENQEILFDNVFLMKLGASLQQTAGNLIHLLDSKFFPDIPIKDKIEKLNSFENADL